MAEAVGLALAVVPLLMSAIEHYGSTVCAFKKYRQYSKRVKRLVLFLKTQREIFRGAVEDFVLMFVDEETADAMLNDETHYCWTDGVMGAKVKDHFSDDCETLSECVVLIKAELDILNKEIAQFGNASSDRSSMKRKIKYAFNEGHLEDSITEVRASTENFRTLIDQKRARAERRKPECRPRINASDGRFRNVQMAASQLYEALVAACTKHTEHEAHLSLELAYETPKPQVRFRLAFRQRASTMVDQSSCSFLTIESSVTGVIVASQGNGPTINLNQAVKRSAACVEIDTPMKCEPKKLMKKEARFRSLSPSRALPMKAPVMPNTLPMPGLVNLCKHSNLCNQLQNILAHERLGQCIGYLEHCSKSKHLMYLDSREQSTSKAPTSSIPAPGSMTLKELLSRLGSGNPLDALSPYERTKLGRQLAQAVLHFHATPWLKANWSSTDILLYGVDLRTDVDSVENNEPYLSVAVGGPTLQCSASRTFPTRTLIRNPLIFGLGVMLLELAYQAPLKSLQKATDVDVREENNTLYRIANRVRYATSKHIGSIGYAKVAYKCIQCDFWEGDDLNDAAVQNVFLREVVQELEKVEARMRELHTEK